MGMKTDRIICCVLLFAFACPSFAKTGGCVKRDCPLVTYGIESSYALTFLSFSHFNYISADGDRRDQRTMSSNIFSNGQFLIHAGLNVSPAVNISLYTGYSGIYRGERMIPLSLRATWFPSAKRPDEHRWLLFCSGGTGFSDFDDVDYSLEGKVGAGYRISLNRSVKLDFLFSIQEVFTHPGAYESDAMDYVPAERLRRNDAYITAATIGIALVF